MAWRVRSNRLFVVGLVVFLMVCGAALRLHNASTYKFYPDSYQNLIVANNLHEYGSPVGTLGPEGMLYPDIFSWTRPVYSTAINTIGWFGPSSVYAARLAALLFGVAAIPIAYLLGKRVTGRRFGGLAAALILSVSFSHVVWSGFILTETTGVFLLLCLLERLLATTAKTSKGGDVLCGLLFSLSVLARYEYIILVLPIILLHLWRPRAPMGKLAVFLAAAFFGLSLGWVLMLPLPYSGAAVWYHVKSFVVLLPLSALAFGVYLLLHKYRLAIRLRYKLPAGLVTLPVQLGFMAGVAVSAVIIGYILMVDISGMVKFVVQDFMICGLFLLGVVAMWRRKAQRPLLVFVLVACALLGAAYYMVNPAMQRYLTHLLPFLLIPVAFVCLALWQKFRALHSGKPMLALLFIAIFVLQVGQSYIGLHRRSGNIWFQPAYEEQAALKIKELTVGQDVLLASFPEPYFYFTGRSTYSLADKYPFIYMDARLDHRWLIIVQDMGMADQFPNFDSFLTNHMQQFQVSEFWTGTPYRYQARIEQENRPVRVYKTTPAALRYKLNQK